MTSNHNQQTTLKQTTLVDEAIRRAEAGCSCSEAVMVVYGPTFGLAPEAAMKVAAGFGGGMGLMGKPAAWSLPPSWC